jgi:hypothetical protein
MAKLQRVIEPDVEASAMTAAAGLIAQVGGVPLQFLCWEGNYYDKISKSGAFGLPHDQSSCCVSIGGLRPAGQIEQRQ